VGSIPIVCASNRLPSDMYLISFIICSIVNFVRLSCNKIKDKFIYLYIYLFITQDLTQVISGALAKKLLKWIQVGASHVYSCTRCSQLGFYCEICKRPKVIFPFEITTTVRVIDLSFNGSGQYLGILIFDILIF